MGIRLHTVHRRRTRAALPPKLLQRVDSDVEVDVFTAAALVHQLLLIEGLKQQPNPLVMRKGCPRIHSIVSKKSGSGGSMKR